MIFIEINIRKSYFWSILVMCLLEYKEMSVPGNLIIIIGFEVNVNPLQPERLLSKHGNLTAYW